MIAGRRGQLAVTLSSGSVPACAAHRGRLLAYCYIYTGTASMQAWSVNTASRMPESARGWSILQDEHRRAAGPIHCWHVLSRDYVVLRQGFHRVIEDRVL